MRFYTLALVAICPLAAPAQQPLLPVVQSVTTYYPDGRVVTVHTLADGKRVGVEDHTALRVAPTVPAALAAGPVPCEVRPTAKAAPAPLCRTCGNNCDCFNGCACDAKSWDAACAAAPKPGTVVTVPGPPTIIATGPPAPPVIPPTYYTQSYAPVYAPAYSAPVYYTPQAQPQAMPAYRPGVGLSLTGPYGGGLRFGVGACPPGSGR